LDARELLGRGYPYVLVFQLIFGVLQLLDYFRVRYHPMIERRVAGRVFDLGFSLVVPMAAFMVLWAARDAPVWLRGYPEATLHREPNQGSPCTLSGLSRTLCRRADRARLSIRLL